MATIGYLLSNHAFVKTIVYHQIYTFHRELPVSGTSSSTESPKIYHKSVLHLLKYIANLYLSRYSTNLWYILGHSVHPAQELSYILLHFCLAHDSICWHISSSARYQQEKIGSKLPETVTLSNPLMQLQIRIKEKDQIWIRVFRNCRIRILSKILGSKPPLRFVTGLV